MFPSISKDIGIPACRQHLDERTTKIFSTDCIIEALELTLDHNLTIFDDVMYRQIKGTGMGPSNACHYADVSMRDFDNILHSDSLALVHGQESPALLVRFRDDIFVIWLGSLEKLVSLFNFVNTIYTDIKFTMSTPSSCMIEFLDMYVYFKDGIIVIILLYHIEYIIDITD